METPHESSLGDRTARASRRIVDMDRRMAGLIGDHNPDYREIFNIMSHLAKQPSVDVAGREVRYQDVVATGETKDGRVECKLVSAVFRLCAMYLPVWVTTEVGEDEEGPWEKGYNVYFTAYIPVPRYYQVGDDRDSGWMLRWLQELGAQELGIKLVPMSEQVKDSLSEWSDPVRMRVDENGELVMKAMRHPIPGTEVDPLDQVWLDT